MGILNDNAHMCRCSFKSRLYPVTVIYKMYRYGTHLYMLCDNYSQISYKTSGLLLDGTTWCHRVVPPGAHFQYQPTLCQGVPTYQVSSRYLKRFLNY